VNHRNPNPACFDALAKARGVQLPQARSWSILLTSANHGTVGPVGSTFPHAGEHHERVQVMEIVEAGSPPAPGVDLGGLVRLDASDILPGSVGASTALTDERIVQLWEISAHQSAQAGSNKFYDVFARAIEREVAAQAGQVAAPKAELMAELRRWSGDDPGYAAHLIRAAIAEIERLAAAPSAPAQAKPLPAPKVSAPAEPLECWSHNEEDFNAQSLGELVDTHELAPGATVWVGEAVHPEPSSLFSTDWLIENMGEAAYDIAGEHAGEDYPNVSDEQVAELEALVVGWIEKCAPPTFWTVKSVRPYVLTAEDCGAQASTAGGRQEGGDRG